MLRVVLERTVGDLKLPPAVRVVAAANPPDEAADGWELAPPLANRLVHLDWPADGRYIARGLAVGFPVPSLFPFDGGRPDETARLTARATVAAFLEVRPDLVLQLPRSAADSGRGWPSPRSWEAAATLLAASACGRGVGRRPRAAADRSRRRRRGDRVPLLARAPRPARPGGGARESRRVRAAGAERPRVRGDDRSGDRGGRGRRSPSAGSGPGGSSRRRPSARPTSRRSWRGRWPRTGRPGRSCRSRCSSSHRCSAPQDCWRGDEGAAARRAPSRPAAALRRRPGVGRAPGAVPRERAARARPRRDRARGRRAGST